MPFGPSRQCPAKKDRNAWNSPTIKILAWPDPDGDVRGEELRPLYRSIPYAARRDPALYELLALVDALRGGRARERMLAADELRSRLA